MSRKFILNFIKDKLLPIGIILSLNTFLIFLFYYSTIDQEVELLYPMIISIFLLALYGAREWFQYYNFNCKSIASSCEQKRINESIDKIHKDYIKQLNDKEISHNLKNKFLAQWIHNLKAPVTVIDLILQREHNGKLTDKDVISLKEENSVIYQGLQSLLNLMRIEDFSKDYVPCSVNLLDSINTILKRNKNLFIYNNVFPKIEIEDKNLTILTDRKWNEFILEQIISNAIKYSSSKECTKYITIKAKKLKKGQEYYIVLKIIDEGIGIPPHDLNRIFDPFFTGDNGRLHKNSSGIGLYMCSIAAEKLNQKLEITSEVSKGTVVTISYVSEDSV